MCFSTWPLLSAFRTPAVSGHGVSCVKPDGFVSIQQEDAEGVAEYNLYLEIDRGTESQTLLAERAVLYRTHYRAGGFAEWRGGTRERFEEYPFRVLMIFPTAERRNNTAERLLLLEPPIKTLVWSTTMPEIMSDPLGQVWLRPVDYQHAIAGTPFASFGVGQLGKYRRQVDRDAMVETKVAKHRLLGV